MEHGTIVRTSTQAEALRAIDALIALMGVCAGEAPKPLNVTTEQGDEARELDSFGLPKPRNAREACENLRRLRALVEQSFASA